ncbi:MAG: HD domain-containing protein [Armatimonadetes bacterium]|nr:HD domain-containing protein [Armatimonadota bacterium]
MASPLARAIEIAARAHVDQVDKVGAPYVLHPLRMMLRMATDEEKMAAVLHDVVEDTDVSLDDLRREGIPEAVLAAVDALTKRPDEDYTAFVHRAAANPIARRVKMADLEDNMNLLRLQEVTDSAVERLRKYHAHWRILCKE